MGLKPSDDAIESLPDSPAGEECRNGKYDIDIESLRPHDAPLILAFASEWTLGDESAADLAAIRAELRGLGAVLVVVSKAGLWSFQPDDEFERFERGGDAQRLAGRFGVDMTSHGAIAPAVFVLDGDQVRLALRWPPGSDPMRGRLAGALRAAGTELVVEGVRPGRLSPGTLSRREWVLGVLVAGFAAALAEGCGPSRPPVAPATKSAPDSAAAEAGTVELDVILNVNGADLPLRIDPRVSLLDALRERLGLTGTKKGCDHGQCGACTVLMDQRRICSCLTLAAMAQGSRVTTIEGLSHGDDLHPIQAAFLGEDALQCGYCTPGQIMSAVGLVAEGHAHTDDEVREQMSGNICRCGAYSNIVAAIQLARRGA